MRKLIAVILMTITMVMCGNAFTFHATMEDGSDESVEFECKSISIEDGETIQFLIRKAHFNHTLRIADRTSDHNCYVVSGYEDKSDINSLWGCIIPKDEWEYFKYLMF